MPKLALKCLEKNGENSKFNATYLLADWLNLAQTSSNSAKDARAIWLTRSVEHDLGQSACNQGSIDIPGAEVTQTDGAIFHDEQRARLAVHVAHGQALQGRVGGAAV